MGGEINLFKVSGSKFKVEILLFRICGKACAPAKPKANKKGFIISSIILIGFQILNESASGLFHTYACSQIRTRRGIGHFRIVNFSKTGLLRQAQDDLLLSLTFYSTNQNAARGHTEPCTQRLVRRTGVEVSAVDILKKLIFFKSRSILRDGDFSALNPLQSPLLRMT